MSDYNPWNICTRIDGVIQTKFTQITNRGITCCNKPNVRDIMQSFDSVNVPKLFNTCNFILGQLDVNNHTKFAAYLWIYQFFVKHGCVYFKVHTTYENNDVEFLIPTDCGITFNQTNSKTSFKPNQDNLIQFCDEHKEFYDYTLLQANIFITYIYINNKFIYPEFNRNNTIKCVYRDDSISNPKNKHSHTAKYLIYEDDDNPNIYDYIPICVTGSVNELQHLNIDSKIYNIRQCTGYECVLTNYNSYNGQHIDYLYQEYEIEEPTLFYHSRLVVGGLLFFIFLIIILFYTYYRNNVTKFENTTHKYLDHAINTNSVDSKLKKTFNIHRMANELEHI